MKIDTSEVEEVMTSLANMLGPRATVSMDLSDRSEEILTAQALAGRNVTNLTPSEGEEVAAIAVKHVEAARDARGRIVGDNEAMYQEMGELARDICADKIADLRQAEKAPLSDGYARQKQARFGRTEPILVATGELLADVRSAAIKVTR